MSESDTSRRVVLTACADYAIDHVQAAVAVALSPLGGMEKFVRPGMTVLLKPNLVMAMGVERAACTHPAVVEAVGRLVLDCGGRLLVGDSPGVSTARKVAETCGIAAVVDRLGGRVVEFTLANASRDRDNPNLAMAEMAREVLEADCVINLPKFKTHAMMALTLGVKNCFGCIVGARKFQWHYRAGHSPELFGRMLVDVWRAAHPALTILDGVIGMEGQGPTGGTPRHIGLIAAAENAARLDAACATLVGLRPDAVLTCRVAESAGHARFDDTELCGEDAARFRMDDFRLPPPDRGMHMLPKWMSGLVRRFITSRPEVAAALCTGCGRCAEICPAKAIRMDGRLPVVDAVKCIRCYCCHEFCPPHAMQKRAGFLARLFESRRPGGRDRP